MSRCKAPETPRNEAYYKYAAMTRSEGNAADGFFSSAFTHQYFFCRFYSFAQHKSIPQLLQKHLQRGNDHDHIQPLIIPEMGDPYNLAFGPILPLRHRDPEFFKEKILQFDPVNPRRNLN